MPRKRQIKTPTIDLAFLVSRLGITKVAKRLDVTPATVNRWLKKGPSLKKGPLLQKVLLRAEAGLKGAQTRRDVAAYRETVPLPRRPVMYLSKADGSSGDPFGEDPELTPEQLLPKAPPNPNAKHVAKETGNFVFTPGIRAFETEEYEGFDEVIEVDEWIHDVPLQAIIDNFSLKYDQYVARGYPWVSALLIWCRAIPFNPAYQGDAVLMKMQGSWKWFQWRTKHCRSGFALGNQIQAQFEGYFKDNDQTGQQIEMVGLLTKAEERNYKLYSIKVTNFRTKPGSS